MQGCKKGLDLGPKMHGNVHTGGKQGCAFGYRNIWQRLEVGTWGGALQGGKASLNKARQGGIGRDARGRASLGGWVGRRSMHSRGLGSIAQ